MVVITELEANPEIERYVIDREQIAELTFLSSVQRDIDAVVYFRDGHCEWWAMRHSHRSAPNVTARHFIQKHAQRHGAGYRYWDSNDLGAWESRFTNWLQLCRSINATQDCDLSEAMLRAHETLRLQGHVSLGRLIESIADDPAIALGAVATLLHRGLARADLDRQLLSPETLIHLATPGTEPDPTRLARATFAPREAPIALLTRSPRGRGRPRLALTQGVVPLWLSDPIDLSHLDNDDRVLFRQRKRAVTLFLLNAPPGRIRHFSGVGTREAKRLLDRCLSKDPLTGETFGVRALIPFARVAPGTRKTPINHWPGDGSAGCSYALSQVFTEHEDIRDLIEALILDPCSVADQVPLHYKSSDLGTVFREKLREKGLSDQDWPFCTADRGNKALRQFKRKLLLHRGAHPPSEVSPDERLVQASVPFSFVQLDYQDVGAASAIGITNRYDDTFYLSVPRWSIGYLACEVSGGVLGLCFSFSRQPSTDDALEAVSTTLEDEDRLLEGMHVAPDSDNRALVHHFVPELRGHGFSVLRVDNAWCNRAFDFVNNVIDTFGAFVQYGSFATWWTRNLIESVIGAIDALGAKRLPSTYGANKDDPRRDEPERKAVKYRVLVSDIKRVVMRCVAHHNAERRSQRSEHSTPVTAARACVQRGAAGFLAQPLPASRIKEPRMLYHIATVKVRGKALTRRKSERRRVPYQPLIEWRGGYFRNERTARSPRLIGERVTLFVRRDDCRFARLITASGEDLGVVRANNGWAKRRISFHYLTWLRQSKLLNRPDSLDPTTAWAKDHLRKEMVGKRALKTPRASRDSLKAAMALADATRAELAAEDQAPVAQNVSATAQPVMHERSEPDAQAVSHTPASTVLQSVPRTRKPEAVQKRDGSDVPETQGSAKANTATSAGASTPPSTSSSPLQRHSQKTGKSALADLLNFTSNVVLRRNHRPEGQL